jgi:hypothetical protein
LGGEGTIFMDGGDQYTGYERSRSHQNCLPFNPFPQISVDNFSKEFI